MKNGKHTTFMIDFIEEFINGKMDWYFFKLDYDAYVIEHFPYMERENARLADRFVNTIDRTYENIVDLDLRNEECRSKISVAFDAWLGRVERLKP